MKIEAAAAPAANGAKALKAAKGFEAVFLKEMMKLAMPSDTREQSVYGDCLADALSQEAAKGKGLGLSDWIMEKGLKPLKSAEKARIT